MEGNCFLGLVTAVTGTSQDAATMQHDNSLPVTQKQHNESQSPITIVCKQMDEHPTGLDCIISITGYDVTCITDIIKAFNPNHSMYRNQWLIKYTAW